MQKIIVIPAYNEEESIGDVISSALRFGKVIVVDNNSHDSTVKVSHKAGAEVIRCKIQGAGAATREGIKYALTYKPDIIITIDSDGQHDPLEIGRVCEPIEIGYADVVIGSRFLVKNGMPKYRRLGNDIISMDCNYYADYKIMDTQSCFRAFTRDIAERVELTEDGFGFSTEFIIKARKLGAKIVEVPIRCIYFEEFSQNSTLNPVKHGFNVLMKTEKWRIKEDLKQILTRF